MYSVHLKFYIKFDKIIRNIRIFPQYILIIVVIQKIFNAQT